MRIVQLTIEEVAAEARDLVERTVMQVLPLPGKG